MHSFRGTGRPCCAAIAVIALILTGGDATAAPAAGTELTLADLAWPDTTRSARARGSTEVHAEPKKRDRIGKVAKGTRLGWRRIVATKDRCKAWLEIEPRGWVCAKDVAPSDDAPAAETQPVLDDGALVPGEFADVRKDGADVFATVADIKAGTPTGHVPSETFVKVKAKTRKVAGVKYVKTDQGWLAASRLRPHAPSEFAGLDLIASPPPGWPFGWTAAKKPGKPVIVRDRASKRGAAVRELPPRTMVQVHELDGKWARIGDGEWVEAREVRMVTRLAPPEGLAADARWLDVDLDNQTLVAYEGATPVFATLISSGRKKYRTPVGVYRIRRKLGKTRMQNREGSREAWNVADVPWAMPFREHFAVHGTYWHDGFGRPRSHGCVNLSPRDARRIYHWTWPEVPDGWTEVEAPEDGGTVVRIRTEDQPDPPWKDWKGKPAGKKKSRKVARR